MSNTKTEAQENDDNYTTHIIVAQTIKRSLVAFVAGKISYNVLKIFVNDALEIYTGNQIIFKDWEV